MTVQESIDGNGGIFDNLGREIRNLQLCYTVRGPKSLSIGDGMMDSSSQDCTGVWITRWLDWLLDFT